MKHSTREVRDAHLWQAAILVVTGTICVHLMSTVPIGLEVMVAFMLDVFFHLHVALPSSILALATLKLLSTAIAPPTEIPQLSCLMAIKQLTNALLLLQGEINE